MNDLKKYMTTLGLLTLILAVFTNGASGSPILDQSQELFYGGSAFFNYVSLAQTFTPAIGGELDHVDLHIEGFLGVGNPTYPATISIVQTVADVPSGAVLGAVNVPGFVVGWNSIDFLGESVILNAGTKYGIVLANNDIRKDIAPTDAFNVQWDINPYSAGALWERTLATGVWQLAVFDTSSPPGVADGAFRTYMVVPEPASLGLLLIAGLALLRHRRSA